MLASALLVVSQLARTATEKHQIERFIDSGIMKLIPPLLEHPVSCGVRARTCNLLGNLCRYSDAIYPIIRQSNILPVLMQLCGDEDRSTRKFACFAIGNAGFHSDFLYPDLTPAVSILVGLLDDDEDRTRANAAGALGNLVRNSRELVPEMINSGAIEALLRIIQDSVHENETRSTAFQISLFSLGNLAAHEECRELFHAHDVESIMLNVINTRSASSTTIKYANRVLQKLSAQQSLCKPVQQTPLREPR